MQIPKKTHNMIYRHLGPTGIKVSVISFGNWLNSNPKEAQQLTTKCVKTAWDLGINFFDTAQVYGFGEAQTQIGNAIRALNIPRHHYVLSTKLFWGTKEKIPNRRGLSRKHIIEGAKASLKRLQQDYVDILFCHRPDPETPVEETCRAFDWLIRKGFVFYWGTSEWNEYEIAEAHMVCEKYGLIKPVVQQPQYNIFTRDKMQQKFKKLFSEKKLGTTVWSPLASGILTGKYNNGVPKDSRFENNPDMIHIYNRHFKEDTKQKTVENLNKFSDLAKSLDCSMAQLALAWVISNTDVSTALTGASRPQQLIETVKAVDVMQKLTPEIQKKIQEIFGTEPVGGINMKIFAPQKSRRRELLEY